MLPHRPTLRMFLVAFSLLLFTRLVEEWCLSYLHNKYPFVHRDTPVLVETVLGDGIDNALAKKEDLEKIKVTSGMNDIPSEKDVRISLLKSKLASDNLHTDQSYDAETGREEDYMDLTSEEFAILAEPCSFNCSDKLSGEDEKELQVIDKAVDLTSEANIVISTDEDRTRPTRDHGRGTGTSPITAAPITQVNIPTDVQENALHVENEKITEVTIVVFALMMVILGSVLWMAVYSFVAMSTIRKFFCNARNERHEQDMVYYEVYHSI